MLPDISKKKHFSSSSYAYLNEGFVKDHIFSAQKNAEIRRRIQDIERTTGLFESQSCMDPCYNVKSNLEIDSEAITAVWSSFK